MKKKIVIASLDSPHLRSTFNLVAPLFDEVYLISDKKQDYAETLVVNFRISNPLSAITNILKIRKFLKSYQPEVVQIAQANSVGLVMGKAANGISPIVLNTWGSDVLIAPKQGKIKKWIATKALEYANEVTADADFMADAINDLCPSAKVTIANFGIEMESFTPIPKEKIIYSNRLHSKLYRIDLIIEGFAEFSKTNPDWKLVIGANGNLTEELKRKAADLMDEKLFEFIGFVNKETNYSYYQKSQIWVSVPESDGTAMSLLEAMYFGCIPVVSDLPANAQWIGKDNGVLVKQSVTEAFEIACEMDGIKVGRINSELIESKASIDAMRKVYAQIYARL
jgi:glycosyltransferase involved in cell wall biosynthesis